MSFTQYKCIYSNYIFYCHFKEIIIVSHFGCNNHAVEIWYHDSLQLHPVTEAGNHLSDTCYEEIMEKFKFFTQYFLL